ncbi:outer membrane transport energization protein ExbB [Sulfuritortus calidifontis]|uniref:Outer membrane transport energization protein ExbB n=1 Tax=Sulfuritortus calidifontis TaxID=1914471 RepID=A0A4R3JZG8_9PROT|nr:TonB-system energizer ExbB [Sulfuritortus calidifontis]TCS73250.1 outer membrane transport energization protein ExbB [Sulfuritortus calidifontis]
MDGLNQLVEWGVIGLLFALSVWALAVALERFAFYRRLQPADYATRVELEVALTRRLTVIGTVAANAPYIGLLGTVLGIMLTFQSMGASGDMDVKSIMTGLALALKATAMGLLVAIPCVALNNALRRRVRERLAEFDAAKERAGG